MYWFLAKKFSPKFSYMQNNYFLMFQGLILCPPEVRGFLFWSINRQSIQYGKDNRLLWPESWPQKFLLQLLSLLEVFAWKKYLLLCYVKSNKERSSHDTPCCTVPGSKRKKIIIRKMNEIYWTIEIMTRILSRAWWFFKISQTSIKLFAIVSSDTTSLPV